MRVLLLNGPNLNLLGTRDPEVYGSTTLAELEVQVRGWAAELGISDVEAFQSNHEGHLIDRLHAARGTVDGIVFNPGALTHTSYALHDAIEAVGVPTVETHISDVEAREPWRRTSVVRPACAYTVYGRGVESYRWALRHLIARAAWPTQTLTYGSDDPAQHADLRLPERDGPAPLVVTVHGGFWRHRWTADTIEMSALDLARRGLASLNVEYRRVGSPGNPEAGGGGGGATSVIDVADAIRTALAHPGVDSGRWAIAGHSAGGQLALAVVRRLRGVAAPPRLAAALAGVVDLAEAIETGIGDGAARDYVAGGDIAGLDPSALVPLDVPVLLSHGRADENVPLAQSERFLAAARQAGDDVEMIVHDGDHFGYLDPTDPAWTAVADRLTAALA